MAISLNPSGLVNHLEYSLHKGVSRAKADNQKSIEECITQTDKITEEKSSAYQREAMVMAVCAVGLIALAAFGIAVQWKAESAAVNVKAFKFELKTPTTPPHSTQQKEGFKVIIKQLNKDKIFFESLKKASETLINVVNSVQTTYPTYAKISLNHLDHEYQKQNMRWQQLSQERSNSHVQNLLNDVKDMKRRQQQARSAAG